MGEPEAGKPVQKALVGHKVKKDGEKYTFTISSGSVDRDNDTIDPNGWKLEDYRRNPVVLFGHQARMPPIGRAENVGVQSGALKATVIFAEPGTYDLADTVRALVDQEILKSTSVGFIPLKWTFDEKRGGVDYVEQELYEFSIVPIPSNPDALRESKGVDLAPLVEWCEVILDTAKGPGLWVSKEVADTWKQLQGEPASVTIPDAGEVAHVETHAPDDAGSTPAPATPVAPPKLRVLRAPAPARITREEVTTAVQRAVKEEVQAAVRFARGRLD